MDKRNIMGILISVALLIFVIYTFFVHIPSITHDYDEHTWNDAYKGGYVTGISGLPKETINPKFQENYDRGYADGLRINQSKLEGDDNGMP